MMSASLLKKMMGDLFGDVKYVVIDTDKNKYPIGSGRVCFLENQEYQKVMYFLENQGYQKMLNI